MGVYAEPKKEATYDSPNAVQNQIKSILLDNSLSSQQKDKQVSELLPKIKNNKEGITEKIFALEMVYIYLNKQGSMPLSNKKFEEIFADQIKFLSQNETHLNVHEKLALLQYAADTIEANSGSCAGTCVQALDHAFSEQIKWVKADKTLNIKDKISTLAEAANHLLAYSDAYASVDVVDEILSTQLRFLSLTDRTTSSEDKTGIMMNLPPEVALLPKTFEAVSKGYGEQNAHQNKQMELYLQAEIWATDYGPYSVKVAGLNVSHTEIRYDPPYTPVYSEQQEHDEHRDNSWLPKGDSVLPENLPQNMAQMAAVYFEAQIKMAKMIANSTDNASIKQIAEKLEKNAFYAKEKVSGLGTSPEERREAHLLLVQFKRSQLEGALADMEQEQYFAEMYKLADGNPWKTALVWMKENSQSGMLWSALALGAVCPEAGWLAFNYMGSRQMASGIANNDFSEFLWGGTLTVGLLKLGSLSRVYSGAIVTHALMGGTEEVVVGAERSFTPRRLTSIMDNAVFLEGFFRAKMATGKSRGKNAKIDIKEKPKKKTKRYPGLNKMSIGFTGFVFGEDAEEEPGKNPKKGKNGGMEDGEFKMDEEFYKNINGEYQNNNGKNNPENKSGGKQSDGRTSQNGNNWQKKKTENETGKSQNTTNSQKKSGKSGFVEFDKWMKETGQWYIDKLKFTHDQVQIEKGDKTDFTYGEIQAFNEAANDVFKEFEEKFKQKAGIPETDFGVVDLSLKYAAAIEVYLKIVKQLIYQTRNAGLDVKPYEAMYGKYQNRLDRLKKDNMNDGDEWKLTIAENEFSDQMNRLQKEKYKDSTPGDPNVLQFAGSKWDFKFVEMDKLLEDASSGTTLDKGKLKEIEDKAAQGLAYRYHDNANKGKYARPKPMVFSSQAEYAPDIDNFNAICDDIAQIKKTLKESFDNPSTDVNVASLAHKLIILYGQYADNLERYIAILTPDEFFDYTIDSYIQEYWDIKSDIKKLTDKYGSPNSGGTGMGLEDNLHDPTYSKSFTNNQFNKFYKKIDELYGLRMTIDLMLDTREKGIFGSRKPPKPDLQTAGYDDEGPENNYLDDIMAKQNEPAPATRNMDPYYILGVNSGAGMGDIQNAYKRKMTQASATGMAGDYSVDDIIDAYRKIGPKAPPVGPNYLNTIIVPDMGAYPNIFKCQDGNYWPVLGFTENKNPIVGYMADGTRTPIVNYRQDGKPVTEEMMKKNAATNNSGPIADPSRKLCSDNVERSVFYYTNDGLPVLGYTKTGNEIVDFTKDGVVVASDVRAPGGRQVPPLPPVGIDEGLKWTKQMEGQLNQWGVTSRGYMCDDGKFRPVFGTTPDGNPVVGYMTDAAKTPIVNYGKDGKAVTEEMMKSKASSSPAQNGPADGSTTQTTNENNAGFIFARNLKTGKYSGGRTAKRPFVNENGIYQILCLDGNYHQMIGLTPGGDPIFGHLNDAANTLIMNYGLDGKPVVEKAVKNKENKTSSGPVETPDPSRKLCSDGIDRPVFYYTKEGLPVLGYTKTGNEIVDFTKDGVVVAPVARAQGGMQVPPLPPVGIDEGLKWTKQMEGQLNQWGVTSRGYMCDDGKFRPVFGTTPDGNPVVGYMTDAAKTPIVNYGKDGKAVTEEMMPKKETTTHSGPIADPSRKLCSDNVERPVFYYTNDGLPVLGYTKAGNEIVDFTKDGSVTLEDARKRGGRRGPQPLAPLDFNSLAETENSFTQQMKTLGVAKGLLCGDGRYRAIIGKTKAGNPIVGFLDDVNESPIIDFSKEGKPLTEAMKRQKGQGQNTQTKKMENKTVTPAPVSNQGVSGYVFAGNLRQGKYSGKSPKKPFSNENGVYKVLCMDGNYHQLIGLTPEGDPIFDYVKDMAKTPIIGYNWQGRPMTKY